MAMADDFESVWQDTDPSFTAAFDQAWQSHVAGGLPVGAAISTRAGELLATGRNRVYDARGGADPLQRSPIAHAEMNALGSIPDDTDLADCILYSTHQPCSMCESAIQFSDVGKTRFLASDPSGIKPGETYTYFPGTDPRLGLVANVMFLHNVAAVRGPDSGMLSANRIGEPGAVDLALALLQRQVWIGRDDVSVDRAIAAVGADLSGASDGPHIS
jgi:tRNA(Arg) A34 adenosine deaminase TadA